MILIVLKNILNSMKTIISFLFIALISCSRSERPIDNISQSDLNTYFKSILKEMDSTASISKLQIISVDTINEREMYNHFSLMMFGEIENMKLHGDRLLDKYKSQLQLVSLSNGISSTLYKNYKIDADNTYNKLVELARQDSLMAADIRILDSIALKKEVTIFKINPDKIEKAATSLAAFSFQLLRGCLSCGIPSIISCGTTLMSACSSLAKRQIIHIDVLRITLFSIFQPCFISAPSTFVPTLIRALAVW